jgi:hypothetical protein
LKAVDESWDARLTREILNVARRSVRQEGNIQAARIMLDDFDLERTEAYLETVSANKARQINDAIRKALKDENPDAYAIARDVETPRAAETLATGFAAFAVKEAGQQSPDGDIRMKTWIVTSGNSSHPEMSGESVPLGETFSNGQDGPPADHPGCQCLMEIDGGGHPAQKSIVQSLPPVHVYNNVTLPEGAMKSAHYINVEAQPPAEVNVEGPTVNVEPAQTTISEGAVKSYVNVDAPPAPELNVAEGAFQANVTAPDVTVESAPAPNVTVEVKGGKSKKTIEFSDGRKATVEEEDE